MLAPCTFLLTTLSGHRNILKEIVGKMEEQEPEYGEEYSEEISGAVTLPC